VGFRNATDQTIRAYAVEQGHVLVTKDKDFIPTGGSLTAGLQVVWIRTGNVSNRVLIDRLAAGWLRILAHLESGARVVELR
jgi:predicted nuclease of predicted toxin-antitoxin system